MITSLKCFFEEGPNGACVIQKEMSQQCIPDGHDKNLAFQYKMPPTKSLNVPLNHCSGDQLNPISVIEQDISSPHKFVSRC